MFRRIIPKSNGKIPRLGEKVRRDCKVEKGDGDYKNTLAALLVD